MTKKLQTKDKKTVVPVFFAADENYMPFLGVTLASLKAQASGKYAYQIHVLYTGELSENAQTVKAMETEHFSITFNDISEKIDAITHLMHCRDYYTSAIYFRLFIPDLFPEYEKAIYLDCDTVALTDIGELFAIDIKDNLIGAVADQAVAAVGPFREYTKNALGIDAEQYFNSGVIVMNLKKMRELNFYGTFCEILRSYEFIVAPDQDCLNLICQDKVYFYESGWNKMPIAGKNEGEIHLIHYNLSMKPWHYSNVLYEEHFWKYASQTPFLEKIQAKKDAFTPEMAKRDEEGGERLIALAQAEADSPCNYYKTVGFQRRKQEKKNENEAGRYGFIENFTQSAGSLKAD